MSTDLRRIALGQQAAIAAGARWISGPELRDMRTRANLTQAELAQLVDCSAGHISKCEAGRMRMSVTLAGIIHSALASRSRSLP